jgi:GGDEF domain-containing protein
MQNSPSAEENRSATVLATAGVGLEVARRLEVGEPRLVTSGAEVLAAAPEAALAVLGEELADGPAVELVRKLRQGSVAAGLPVFVVTEQYTEAAEAEALDAGADEYLDFTQVRSRLLRRLRARLERAWMRREENPLTGLPGRGRLDRELGRRLPERGSVALMAVDVSGFKAFNDHYGFDRGDRLLLLLRDILLEALAASGGLGDLALHLGGDDFFLLTGPGRAEALARSVREKFDLLVPGLYDDADREAGGFAGFSRSGERLWVPIAHLTLALATNEAADVQHAGQLAEILAELKEFARGTGNRELVVDRRTIHDARRSWDRRRPSEKEE